MKRLYIITISIILFEFSGFSQNTGFLGKRVIVKTDIVNGLQLGFSNIDIEATVSRRMSVNASFRYINYKDLFGGYQVKTGEFQQDPTNRNWKVFDEFRTLSDGTTQGWIVSIGTRYYFNNIVPAPLGLYTEINLGYGQLEFSDYSVSFRYVNVDPFEPFTYSRPDIKNLSGTSTTFHFEFPSIGYQKALLKFITFDVKMSFQGYYCDLPANLSDAMPDNVYIRPNLVGFSSGNLAMGLALYGKLGILLF